MTRGADRTRGRRLAGAIGASLLALTAAHAQPLPLSPTAQNPTAQSSVAVAPEAQKGVRQEELDKLMADLAELVRLRSEIAAERDGLGRDLAPLSQERSRMTVLVAERQRKQSETEKALESERARSVQLARQADNLKEHIGRIEQEITSAARVAAAARGTDSKASLAALN